MTLLTCNCMCYIVFYLVTKPSTLPPAPLPDPHPVKPKPLTLPPAPLPNPCPVEPKPPVNNDTEGK